MIAYLLVGNYKMPDGNKWFDKDTFHEILMFYKARVTPWSGPWPDLMHCMRSEYLTRQEWLEKLRLGMTLREAIIASMGRMHGIWMWAQTS